jgi:hypothetical protein
MITGGSNVDLQNKR